eukprot:8208035-Pyramimonas_sp.AAC.1
MMLLLLMMVFDDDDDEEEEEEEEEEGRGAELDCISLQFAWTVAHGCCPSLLPPLDLRVQLGVLGFGNIPPRRVSACSLGVETPILLRRATLMRRGFGGGHIRKLGFGFVPHLRASDLRPQQF